MQKCITIKRNGAGTVSEIWTRFILDVLVICTKSNDNRTNHSEMTSTEPDWLVLVLQSLCLKEVTPKMMTNDESCFLLILIEEERLELLFRSL